MRKKGAGLIYLASGVGAVRVGHTRRCCGDIVEVLCFHCGGTLFCGALVKYCGCVKPGSTEVLHELTHNYLPSSVTEEP